MDKYSGNDNYGRPKTEYVEGLALRTLDDLEKETKNKIWLSAYANNNPRSDYHWHVDACYDEIKRRTGSDDLYAKWYDKVVSGLG